MTDVGIVLTVVAAVFLAGSGTVSAAYGIQELFAHKIYREQVLKSFEYLPYSGPKYCTSEHKVNTSLYHDIHVRRDAYLKKQEILLKAYEELGGKI